MTEAVCVRCRHDDSNYLDGDAKLTYSQRCGHACCGRCMAELFGRHRSVRCPLPSCGETLTRGDFSDETRDTVEYRREKEVRHRLSSVFNRTATDFHGRDAEWNDYLERVEGYVAALMSGNPREVGAAEAAIEAYRSDNARDIAANNARADATSKRTTDALRAEKARNEAASARAEANIAARRAAAERLRGRVESAVTHAGEITASIETAATSRPLTATGIAQFRQQQLRQTTAVEAARKDLLELRARLLAAAAAHAPATFVAAATAASSGSSSPAPAPSIPCAHVFPPRFMGEPNATAYASSSASSSSSSPLFDASASDRMETRRGRMLRACGIHPLAAVLYLPAVADDWLQSTPLSVDSGHASPPVHRAWSIALDDLQLELSLLRPPRHMVA